MASVPHRSLPKRWYALAVISAITIAASVNRQLIGLIAEPVRREFNLTDTQIGSMFGIVGVAIAVAGPMLGHLVDRTDRHRLIILAIIIWSAATLAYGLSPSYLAIGISLAVLAIAETTMGPAANSIIGDRFSGGDRVNANLVYFAAGGLTAGVGALVGGLLLKLFSSRSVIHLELWDGASPWRQALVVTGVSGIALAILAATLGKDRREQVRTTEVAEGSLKTYWRDHWRTLLTFNLANAGFFFSASTIMGWTPIYLVRHYGIDPADLGLRMGAMIGVADVLGILCGLIAIKWLYKRLGPIAPRYIFQSSLSAIAVLGVFQMFVKDAWGVLLLLACQNFLATFGTASFNNMTQDITSSNVRGRIFGINATFFSLAGIPGPILVGYFSDKLQNLHFGLIGIIVMVTTPALLISVLLYQFSNKSYMKSVKIMS
jgi:MFS family permease